MRYLRLLVSLVLGQYYQEKIVLKDNVKHAAMVVPHEKFKSEQYFYETDTIISYDENYTQFKASNLLIGLFCASYHSEMLANGVKFVPGRIRRFLGYFFGFFLVGMLVAFFINLVESPADGLAMTGILSICLAFIFGMLTIHRQIVILAYRKYFDKVQPS